MRGIAAVAGGAAQLLCSLCLLRGGGAPRRPLSLRPRFAHTLDDAASLDPHLLDHHRTWSALSAPAMDGSWTAGVAREARGALKGNAVKQPTYNFALQYAYNMLSQIMSINRWDGVCPIASVSEGQRLSSGGTGLSHGFSQAAHGSSSS